VTYLLTCDEGEDPHEKARDIALEQTVELPAACVPPAILERIVGRVESVEPLDDGRWRAVISYDPVTYDGEVPQLFNLLFGNISLKRGILLDDVDWPHESLATFPGPRFGTEGLRRLCGCDERRPLLCSALKPLGSNAGELARICTRFALGGADLIKDDHGLTNQPPARFAERVQRCQEAVAAANAKSGGSTLYFPNLPGTAGELGEQLETARAAGCRGVMVSPLLLGPDSVRWAREQFELALLAHPALSGAFLRPEHGFSPALLLGRLFRLIGADAVIYPNVGGRFPFGAETCDSINDALRDTWGPIRPAFPMPGGGIDVGSVPGWVRRYGADTIFLIGGSLYAQPDLEAASRDLLASIRKAADGLR